MLVKNKVAIVTGSARGIGFAIAQVLAEEGAKVVISDLSMSSGEESAKQLQEKGYEAVFIPCDISKRDQVNELFSKTKEHFGTIDVLVNNAGINRDGMLHKLTDDDWDKVIDINLKGTFNCMQEAAKLMREQGSRELARKGVTVNAICPGFIDTDMTRGVPEKVWDIMISKIPAGFAGDPRDVGQCVAFLASDKARYINGEVINVGGGMVL